MGFFSHLESRARQVDSLLCVGLDPHVEFLTEQTAESARDLCLRLIEATAEAACAFKPNAAFFERFGAEGWRALREVVGAIPAGIPVILDAKRGDIPSSAQAYARAAFEGLGVQAITVSPYLGREALEPFLADPARGAFLLCRTSNPGADDLQGLITATGEPLYVHVAREAQSWNTRDNLGLVAAANDPSALAAVREAAPDLWILAPGVGEQGGDAGAALRAGLRTDGLGLLIPVSRSLARAADPRAEALRLRDALRAEPRVRSSGEPGILRGSQAVLADGLLGAGCVRFGLFTLKSGSRSPIYLDLRLLASSPRLLTQAAAAYMPLLRPLEFNRLAAIPYAGLPIGAAIALQGGWPLIYPRKEVKAYGTMAPVEGTFAEGETAVVIDDVATTGGSKVEAVERLQAAGLLVRDVVVLIDREAGARQALAELGVRLHAGFTLRRLLDHWQATGAVEESRIRAVRDYLEAGAA